MRFFLSVVSLLTPVSCYIPYWEQSAPQQIPIEVQPVLIQSPVMPQLNSAPNGPQVAPFVASFPFQGAPIPQSLPPPISSQVTTPLESPWMSLVKSVASVMRKNIDWEREKAYLKKRYETPTQNLRQSSYTRTWNEEKTRKQIPELFHHDPLLLRGTYSGFANLLNSIPIPDIMFKIGDLLQPSPNRQSQVNGGEEKQIQSFPIEKDSNTELRDDGNIIGLVTSGQWKNVDWTRKILGIDEIPTKEEGNAIAQLLSEDSKFTKA